MLYLRIPTGIDETAVLVVRILLDGYPVCSVNQGRQFKECEHIYEFLFTCFQKVPYSMFLVYFTKL